MPLTGITVELYAKIRLAVMVDGLSRREAAMRLGVHRNTITKMLSDSLLFAGAAVAFARLLAGARFDPRRCRAHGAGPGGSRCAHARARGPPGRAHFEPSPPESARYGRDARAAYRGAAQAMLRRVIGW